MLARASGVRLHRLLNVRLVLEGGQRRYSVVYAVTTFSCVRGTAPESRLDGNNTHNNRAGHGGASVMLRMDGNCRGSCQFQLNLTTASTKSKIGVGVLFFWH